MIRSAAAEQGFSLLEILISLVIISIGLLGMAGLQVTSLKQNQSAYMRSQATILAYDIIDRMRANAVSAQDGNYFITSGTVDSDCESTSGCTDSEMASHDVARWQARLAEELPSGGGQVCRDTNTEDSTSSDLTKPVCGSSSDADLPVVVYVWWNDERTGTSVSTRLAVSASI